MKNVCIVIRDKRTPFGGGEFEPVISALIGGGYAPDKTVVVPDDDMREFSQSLVESKNFYDNIFVVAQPSFVPPLRLRVCDILQAVIPKGNVIEKGGKLVVCLPFGGEGAAEAVSALDAKYSVKHDKMVIRAVGASNEKVERAIEQAKTLCGDKLQFHFTEKDGDQRLEVLYDNGTPKMLIDDALRVFAEGFGEHAYAVDDTPLPRRIVELLRLRGLRLSVAESFTGGSIAAAIVSVPGASKVLYEGIVAYDNGAKRRRLGVREDTLAQQGAVSDEAAYEMAAGLIAAGGCDVALSTTGIAGPSSDGTDKPVGLCYLAVGTKQSVYVYKYNFRGSREEISSRAVNQALYLLYRQIK